jgi:hypothetical protein
MVGSFVGGSQYSPASAARVAGGRIEGTPLRSEDLKVGEVSACELCGRFVHELTRHHLIPRSRHKKKRAKKKFDRQEMEERVALLCRPCHRNVHTAIDNKELEQEYNTIEALAAHPDIRKFTRWIGNKPQGTVIVETCKQLKKVSSDDSVSPAPRASGKY